MSNRSGLQLGEIAPDFTLSSTSGQKVTLYSELERSPVVLFFFLKAFTPVCTVEACSFRDEFSRFQDEGAAVFGISSDSHRMAGAFAKQFRLPYPLLIDEESRVRKLYGLPKILGLLDSRSTYVIGRNRTVAHVTHSQFAGRLHVTESLESLHR